jgi:hypothetical protein
MHRLTIPIVLIFMQAPMAWSAELTKNAPNRNTPLKLVEAWLRFHESELCQSVDAVFIFDSKGMEAWYVSKDEGMQQKLRDMFQPPDGSYRVEFYPTRKLPEKRSLDDDGGPPPSLYMNYELRAHLPENLEIFSSDDSESNRRAAEYKKWAIEARLTAYAEQILEWNRRVGRYAADLPRLIRVAMDPSTALESRSMAIAVCKAHAQNMGKILGKLEANLKQAFPSVDKKMHSPKAGKADKAGIPLAESADDISEDARVAVRRIRQFIYPEQHSVTVDDLLQPSLLEDMRSLRQRVLDFRKAMPILPSGKAHAASKSR